MRLSTNRHNIYVFSKRIVPLLIALASLQIVVGCIILPIPHDEKIHYGKRIEPTQLEAFVPGVTTQAEIEGFLGTPEAYWIDERISYYRWDISSWALIVLVCGGYTCDGGMFDLEDVKLLLFQFDEENILKRFEIRTCENFSNVGKQLQEWARERDTP